MLDPKEDNYDWNQDHYDEPDFDYMHDCESVSYTHLTLPTTPYV